MPLKLTSFDLDYASCLRSLFDINTFLELLGHSIVLKQAPFDINTALEPYGYTTVDVITYESLTVVVLGCSNTVTLP